MSMHPIKKLVWNVWGLNNPARRNAIVKAVVAGNPVVRCFEETKMEIVMLDIVRHCLGNKFEHFFYFPAVGTRGVSFWHGILWL